MLKTAARILVAVSLIAFAAQAALAEKRVALIIGNDQYVNLASRSQLKRAVNDARAVSQAFTDLGFNVTEVENVSRSAFNAKWQQFLLDVQEGDVVAFYFSGHGIEVEGLNFLIPSDIPNVQYGRQEQIKRESISVSELLLDLKKHKPGVSLIILDACRAHPLPPIELRSADETPGGLAKMDAPNGTFIMYSAGAGQTSLERLPPPMIDPDPINSVFTRKLLPLMRQKGLGLTELAREARKQVHALAMTVPHEQTPAYYDGVLGELCLAGCEVSPPAALNSTGGPVARKSDRLQGPETAVVVPKPSSETTDNDGACDGLRVSVAMAAEKPCLKPGSGESFKDCGECPEMVIAPAGRFIMGSPKNEPERSIEEGPQHKVTIAEPFAVCKFAVTFAEWEACVATGGCGGYRPNDEGWGRGNRPVTNMSWNDAKAYVSWLSKKTGKSYRLLSEAEREYVTRAGTMTSYWWGNSITSRQANYDASSVYSGGGKEGEFRHKTVSVMSFKPNPWGLYQVHGNIWEWVEDCWHDTYAGAPTDGSAWTDEDCEYRVFRGGTWHSLAKYLRSAFRHSGLPAVRQYFFGFGLRVARTLE